LELKDVVSVSLGAVGAALGIINTLNALNQQKVKLRVVPKIAMPFINGQFGKDMGCIEVTNLSAFSVTVSEIGFTMNGRKLGKGNRVTITDPFTADHQPFARRLQSRESITGYFDLNGITSTIGRAYVKTDCGEVAYGAGPAIDSIRKRATG